jgi:hypothetical protein
MIVLAGRFLGICCIKNSAFLSEEKRPFLEMFKIVNFHRRFSGWAGGALGMLLIPIPSLMYVFFNK